MSKKVAELIIKCRIPIIIFLFIITVFFFLQMKEVKLSTDFGDLLPQEHPYIKVHNQFRETFGGANFIYIELEVNKGDIFNPKTLEKISMISNEIMFIEGINRESVFSIASRKAKEYKIDEEGIISECLMWPEAPQTKEGVERLKGIVYANDVYYGPYVSYDSRSALIIADLYEWGIDYERIYREIVELCESQLDENTSVYMSGTPILYGFLYVNLDKIISILGITILAMLILLYSYSRKIVEMIIPLFSAFICAIWGFGFANLLGYDLDPLIIVVPILISTRILSHSVQLIERYFEEYQRYGDVKAGVQASIEGLFFPGLAGIITDAAGILIICIIPIPILQKLGVICFCWAIFSTFIVLILNPILLLYYPHSKISVKKEGKSIVENILYKIGRVNTRKRNNWVIVVITVIITFASIWISNYLVVGQILPGTPILWPDSKYNQDVKHINQKFPGSHPLLIAIEGDKHHAVKDPYLVHILEKYERLIERDPNVGGSISFVDVIKKVNMNFHEGDPKWEILPKDLHSIGTLMYMFLGTGGPDDFAKYSDYHHKYASLTVYYKNKKAKTVSDALQKSKTFFASHPVEGINFNLAGGIIGVMGAMNETIFSYQVELFVLALLTVCVFCAIFLRSFFAGIILIISLAIANFMVFGYMVIKNIGLDVNTLPVASIAIGIGVDYGIYLFGRMKEEYSKSKDLNATIITSIVTTGKAITFTAITIAVGVFIWYFSYIRFQAEMGLLLSVVTIFHLLGTLFFLPALIAIIKPKFITKV